MIYGTKCAPTSNEDTALAPSGNAKFVEWAIIVTVGAKFVPIYKIDKNYSNGKMTPVRNEIMAKIAERGSLNVSYMKIYKNNKSKITKVS